MTLRKRRASTARARTQAAGPSYRDAFLAQQPRRQERHRATRRALILAFLPGDTRDIEMSPVVFLRELGKEAGSRDAASCASRDVGKVGEVAGETLMII